MFPFNSETKKMTVVVELEHQKKVRVYTKGASENIIDDCAYIQDASMQHQSQVVNLDLNKRESIKKDILTQMAQAQLRTIALGYKDMSYEEYQRLMLPYNEDEVQSPLAVHSGSRKFEEVKQIDEDKLLSETEPISEDDDKLEQQSWKRKAIEA